MVWRKSTTPKDRILACLPYIVPLLEVFLFGSFLFILVPPLQLLFIPLMPLLPIYYADFGIGIGVVQFAIFIALYVGIVRDERFSHFMRFNTIQAMLLGFFAALCNAFLGLLGLSQEVLLSRFANNLEVGSGFAGGAGVVIMAIVYSAIFLIVVSGCVYSVVQSLRGRYAELPLISEAAYSQVQ